MPDVTKPVNKKAAPAPAAPAKQVATPYFGFATRAQVEQVPENNWLIGAIYGDFGVGKTYWAGTVERAIMATKYDDSILQSQLPAGTIIQHGTILANAEKGEKGIPLDCTDLVIQPILTYKDFSKLFDFLRLHHKFRATNNGTKLLELQASYFKIPAEYNTKLMLFEAVIVDSLTEVQKYCLYQLIGLTPDSKLEEEPDQMRIQQWGTALEMILMMVRKFRALPMHKLFVIQQAEDTDERKKLFYRPALQGAAKLSILGFFDFVGFYVMDVKEDMTKRRLYLSPVGPFKAKHRFEKFHKHYIDNPEFSTILAAQEGKLN